MINLYLLYPASFWKIAAAEVIIAGVIQLIIYVPMLFRLTFRKFQSVHKAVTSDIPGNPHAFDNLIISLFKTLPEPNNLNLVWTRVPLAEDCVVRGEMPPSRMSSWSIYGEGGDGVPASVELFGNIEKDSRHFEVILTKNPAKYEKIQAGLNKNGDRKLIIIDTKDWEYGMCVMRNYLVPPGTLVYTPEISTFSKINEKTGEITVITSDDSLLRKAQKIISGPQTLHIDFDQQKEKIYQFLILHLFLWLLNRFLFNVMHPHDRIHYNLWISGLSLFLTYLYYISLFTIGKKKLYNFISKFYPKQVENSFVLTHLTESSKVSQPSKLHTYWIMRYNITTLLKLNQELIIRGKIQSKNQLYWSFVFYDEYGIPLSQFLYDLNVKRIPIQESMNGTCDTNDEYAYEIHVNGHDSNSGGGKKSYDGNKYATKMDVSRSKKGYVLFRLVHPVVSDMNRINAYSQPETQVVDVGNPTASNSTRQKQE